MAEKRPLADFSRFSFVEGADVMDSRTSGHDHDVSGIENKRAKVLPSVPTKKLSKQVEVNEVQTAAAAGGLLELYKSAGCVERPLKLLVVGHNPSDQSWSKGHYYANPSNRMWFLLDKAGIIPSGFKANCDKRCPNELGVGFTDVMSGIPDTQSCNITDSTLKSHKGAFFKRLEAHTQRAASESECNISAEDAYPRVIAFAGVRQWKALFPAGHFDDTASAKKDKAIAKNQPLLTNMFSSLKAGTNSVSVLIEKVASEASSELTVDGGSVTGSSKARQSTIPYGVQTQRPDGWPAALRQSVVFLLPSSSGAAALSNAEREGPYLELGRLLQEDQYRWVPGAGLAQLLPLNAANTVPTGLETIVEKDTKDGETAYQECVDLSASPDAPPPTSSFGRFEHVVIDLSDL